MAFRDSEYNLALGFFLREQRSKNNLSQRAVGKALGYSSSQFLSNIECGIAPALIDVLLELKKLYKIPRTEFVDFKLNLEKQFWKRYFTK